MSTLAFIALTGFGIIIAWLSWEGHAIYTGKKLITDVIRDLGVAGAALICLVIGLLIGHFWL